MKRIIFFLFVLTAFYNSNAQNPEWLTIETQPSNPYKKAFANYGDYIWLGTQYGLLRFDKIAGTYEKFTSQNSGLPVNKVLSIAMDRIGYLWFGTSYGGLLKYDGFNWQSYNSLNSDNPCNYINTIAVDNLNNIWFGCDVFPPYVLKYDGFNFSIYNEYSVENHKVYWWGIVQLNADNIGNVWAGFCYGGLYKYNGTEWEDHTRSLADSYLRTIAVEKDGEIVWIGVDGIERSLWSYRNGNWNHEIYDEEFYCSFISIDTSNTILKIFDYGQDNYDVISINGNSFDNFNFTEGKFPAACGE